LRWTLTTLRPSLSWPMSSPPSAGRKNPDRSHVESYRLIRTTSARGDVVAYLDGQAGYEQRLLSPHATLRRGRSLKEKENSRAVEELESALRIEPRYYRALIALADIWLKKASTAGAVTAQLLRGRSGGLDRSFRTELCSSRDKRAGPDRDRSG
jgi:hypothetical protein